MPFFPFAYCAQCTRVLKWKKKLTEKVMKKIISILLFLILSLSLFACGGGNGGDDGKKCGECIDNDNSGTCDECGEAMPEEPISDINLIDDGVASFKIVLGSGIATDVRKYVDQSIVGKLRNKYDIELVSVQEGGSNDTQQEIEVLIGDVTSRGEQYIFDKYTLGKEGYMIRIVGSKVIINAGSDKQLLIAVTEFAEDILKIGSDDVFYATMTPSDMVYKVQDNYKITSLSVGSGDMKGYTIAADTTNDYYKAAALAIQDTVYDKTGYYFKIVKQEEAGDKSIILRHIDKIAGEESFTIKTDGSRLVISCAYDNMLEQATGEFLNQFITLQRNESVSFSGTVFKRDISVVYYEDFGAKGDGKTNDYQAFYDTHTFANECGQTVKADSKKTYRLSDPTVKTKIGDILFGSIPIKTSVEWGDANIIIDDSAIDYHDPKTKGMAQTWVFRVFSDYAVEEWKASSNLYKDKIAALGKVGYSYGTTKIELGLGYPAMIIIYNENHEVYRRTGSDRYDGSGAAQHEVILLDKDGNIDESTPFMFDYEEITKIQIYRLDMEPITISGGIVTTIAPQFDTRYYVDGTDENGNPAKVEVDAGYFARGLYINRSFTTVDGLRHYVENEVTVEQYFTQHLQGAVYNGFFNASNANDVLIKNCVMTGRRCYNTHGTYEFSASGVNKIVLENCYQHNFWVDEEGNPSDENTGRTSMDAVSYEGVVAEDGKTSVQYCWGLGGTNFCKNMHYIDSRLSRFDAHCGLYDGSIEGCEISFFEIIGKGTFVLRDTTFYSNGSPELVYLRGDYGCTWEGNFLIENVHCYIPPNTQFNVFRHGLTNWYYGYKCHIPAVEIKDIYFYNNKTLERFDSSYRYIHMYSKISDKYMHLETLSSGVKNENPIGVPEYIKVTSNAGGYTFNIPYFNDVNSFLMNVKFYSGTERVTYKEGKQGCFNFIA